MHTITLELLRHGPAHNQLLSPLTPYMALCDNHEAVTVNLDFSHNQFLHRLDALSYSQTPEARAFQLKDTAALLGSVLSKIPGLSAAAPGMDPAAFTHLRLILSASELALLPFELALSPQGLPGSGQQLLLQPQMPVCLTREARRAPEEEVDWSGREIRILFVAAAPPQVGDIPYEAHLLALRRAIDPWVRHYRDKDQREERIATHFEFLPEATIESIEERCSTGGFTHVHILAHGQRMDVGHDVRYALALHDRRDRSRADLVSGERLATALRASRRAGDGRPVRPLCVTLASCDSGNVGSVAGPGASIAHALHQAGIPMVVAGQFPLSFAGSVRIAEVLYKALLWGMDPRIAVHDLRKRLFSQFPETHDWASLTVYLSLSNGFDGQIEAKRIERAMENINAAMSHADAVIRRLSSSLSKPDPGGALEDMRRLREGARTRMTASRQSLARLLDAIPSKKGRIHGLLASTAKRQGEVLYRGNDTKDQNAARKCLADARDAYWKSFIADRSSYWAAVQYLSAALVLAKWADSTSSTPIGPPAGPERSPADLWKLARSLSLQDLNHPNTQTRSWALGNLVELHLLSVLTEVGGVQPAAATSDAVIHTRQLIDVAGPESFEIFSTRRQVLRYIEWYHPVAGQDFQEVRQIADQVYSLLPQTEHF